MAVHTVWLLAGAGAASAQSGAAAVATNGRAALRPNVGNPVLAVKDTTTGEARGVTVDLGRALAVRLGVPVALVEYPNVARIVDGARSGAWDIAFLANDPARAGDMDFTPPYMEVEDTYLVPTGSPIHTTAEADRPGIRIAVPSRSAPDVFLSGRLKQASLVRGETEAAAFQLLRTGQADAFAANRNSFATFTAGLGGYRALDDYFLAVPMAIAVPKGSSQCARDGQRLSGRGEGIRRRAAGDRACPPGRRPGRARSGGKVKRRRKPAGASHDPTPCSTAVGGGG